MPTCYDRVFESSDPVTVQHSWQLTDDGSIDYVTTAREVLEAVDGSNRYIQASIVLWPPFDVYPDDYPERVVEAFEFTGSTTSSPSTGQKRVQHPEAVPRARAGQSPR